MKKPLIITVTSNKGGVGKTTTCAAMCDILRRKYQVLLIDTDPQGNCAGKFGVNVPEDEGNLGRALVDRIGPNDRWKPMADYITVNDEYENLAILAGGKTLKNGCYDYIFSVNASAALKSFRRIINGIAELKRFDFIIVDTPPTYGNEIYAILNATDYALLPTLAEADSVEGVDVALRFISAAREDNQNLKVAGIFLNRVYGKDTATKQIEPIIRQQWKGDVLNTVIPDNRSAAAKAINFGEPITKSDPHSKAALSYVDLVKEVEERVS